MRIIFYDLEDKRVILPVRVTSCLLFRRFPYAYFHQPMPKAPSMFTQSKKEHKKELNKQITITKQFTMVSNFKLIASLFIEFGAVLSAVVLIYMNLHRNKESQTLQFSFQI